MTPDSLYAALDCENADIDLILGLIADWYADHCDERREAACRWMVAHGKRPDEFWGWDWKDSDQNNCLHLVRKIEHGSYLPWYIATQPYPDYYRHAVDALSDQWPAEVADWWHALRTRGEEPVANLNTQEA